MKKFHKSILILVTFLFFLILCFCNSTIILTNILDYSKLFLTKVFPASFLFYTLSYLLVEYGIIQIIFYVFNINASSLYVFLLSLISGFPSGAKYTKELLNKGFINESEANEIIKFSHFPNPLFIIGVISNILDDTLLAKKILLSIILSNFILFLFRKRKSNTFVLEHKIEVPDFSNTLSKAIQQAFYTLSLIYGTSLYFYLISFLLTKYLSFSKYFFVFISGIFDLTKGVFATTLFANNFIRAIFILFFISFGGISIHMQVRAIISDTSISYKNFFLGRIVGTFISFVFFLIMVAL